MQPQTTLERAYAICCMIVGASIYAYMVGAVCGIVASMDPDNREFYGNMDTCDPRATIGMLDTGTTCAFDCCS